jgi:hypothetical protein
MGGLKVRCKYCGWVDGTKVVYVFLVVVLAGVMSYAVYYVKGEPNGGTPNIVWKNRGQGGYGH